MSDPAGRGGGTDRPMAVLGIDTSTPATAVCVLRADGASFEAVPELSELVSAPAHARVLMPRVASQLRAARVGFNELDCVAVGVGPGGYTGLRIGIASARAMAQAHRLALRPVSSLTALAAGIDASVALPLIDARRGELFAALEVGSEQRWPPFLTRAADLVERVGAARREGLATPLAAGDGSLRFRQVLEAASIEVAPAGSRRHVVRALHICRLAAGAPALAHEAVVPSYLRPPDARAP